MSSAHDNEEDRQGGTPGFGILRKRRASSDALEAVDELLAAALAAQAALEEPAEPLHQGFEERDDTEPFDVLESEFDDSSLELPDQLIDVVVEHGAEDDQAEPEPRFPDTDAAPTGGYDTADLHEEADLEDAAPDELSGGYDEAPTRTAALTPSLALEAAEPTVVRDVAELAGYTPNAEMAVPGPATAERNDVAARWSAVEPRPATASTALTRVEGTPDLESRTGARRRRAVAGGLMAAAVVGGVAVAVLAPREAPRRPETPVALPPVAMPPPAPAPAPVPTPPSRSPTPVEQRPTEAVAPEALAPLSYDAGTASPDPIDPETEAFLEAYYDDFYGEDYLVGYEGDDDEAGYDDEVESP